MAFPVIKSANSAVLVLFLQKFMVCSCSGHKSLSPDFRELFLSTLIGSVGELCVNPIGGMGLLYLS